MESIINFACEYASSAHWIFFLLLMLAGLNIPISEDIILLTAGALASTCLEGSVLYLFAWVYAGSWISAWEAYWIGRYFGPKLYDFRWFRYILTPQRVKRLHHYYEKFGILTFMVARFVPGGVRNALYMTSGLGKMPFLIFIIRDGLSCIISATTIFSIGYYLGSNNQAIIKFVHTYREIAYTLFAVVLAVGLFFLWRYRRRSNNTES
jgi:membrane protein DedA with SNARE-associated domain